MGKARARRSAPAPGRRDTQLWHHQPATVGELTGLRVGLRADLRRGALGLRTDDDGEHPLLLVFEELVSKALRYGRPPVEVTFTVAGSGWLLAVSDAAPDRPPVPAVDRDAALGGMGLGLVARLSGDFGWTVVGDRKVVWACVGYAPDPVTPERIRANAECALVLATRVAEVSHRLTLTSTTVAATRDRLAVAAAAAGRPETARRHRAAARHAHRAANQARRMVRPSPRTSAPPRPGGRPGW